MRIGEICTRYVVFCTPKTPIVEVARLMREHHVGSVIVAEDRAQGRVPTGLITDRDIVVELVPFDVPIESLTAGDIKTADIITVPESEDVLEALDLMRRKGVRRMPVVSAHGVLVGIVTLDDLLEVLAEQIGAMVKLISHEQSREANTRPALHS